MLCGTGDYLGFSCGYVLMGEVNEIIPESLLFRRLLGNLSQEYIKSWSHMHKEK